MYSVHDEHMKYSRKRRFTSSTHPVPILSISVPRVGVFLGFHCEGDASLGLLSSAVWVDYVRRHALLVVVRDNLVVSEQLHPPPRHRQLWNH